MESQQTTRVIILITKYQLSQLSLLANALELQRSSNYIAYSSFIESHELSTLPSTKLFPYSTKEFQLEPIRLSKRFFSILLKPLSIIANYRSIVTRNKKFISTIAEAIPAKNVELIIFNDRDFLTQLSILEFQNNKKLSNVIAIDEGLGYYVKEGMREKSLRVVYKLISRLMLGFDYKFIEQYGTHPSINEVYLRFPNQMTAKKNHIVYHKIPSLLSHSKKINVTKRPALLFFSTLFSEENYLTVEDEQSFYIFLASEMNRKNMSLVWKPHPRENAAKIEGIENILQSELGANYHRFEADVDVESIDYSTFDWVLNIGSTVMLYILESGFPPKHVINLPLYNFNLQLMNGIITVNFYRYKEFIPRILDGAGDLNSRETA